MHRPSQDLAVDSKFTPPSTPTIAMSSPPPSIRPTRPYAPPQPSVRLLYSFITTRDLFTTVLPAVILSLCTGITAPFMTVILGQAFNVFASYPRDTTPTPADRHTLLAGVGRASLELLGLGIGSFCLTAAMSAAWIAAGERNVMRLRKRVYEAVASREMQWFDAKLGGDDDSVDGEEKLGSGGLMAKFAKDTDEVREASALAMGQLLSNLATIIVAFVLAMRASWALTLVVLATVPISILIQGVSSSLAGPLLAGERSTFARAGDVISRSVSSIATVKAFNAIPFEARRFGEQLDVLKRVIYKQALLFGITTAFSQFTMLCMFVQGFWFGSHLMRKGQVSFGQVVQVFWACVVIASSFGTVVPNMITLARGKWAMVSLVTLINPPPTETPSPRVSRTSFQQVPLSPASHRTLVPLGKRGAHTNFRKIRPTGIPNGEISLRNISFSYPSRPDQAALTDVSMFIPAKEMTFVVGPSGSGKSTIAQLLLRMYEPDNGTIDFDDQALEYLDESFTKEHVAAVAQGCVLFDMSVHDNVAMGLAGVPGRSPETATREEVMEACRMMLVHEFVRDLPNGYKTQLGSHGANISGGQRQRLAIARARLRDPTVLILDEATSALDPVTRSLVFSAVRRWRKGRTTLVITHDLNLIEKNDFVYIMKDGQVAEQGFCEDLEAANTSLWNEMRQFSGDVRSPVPYGWAPEIQVDTASEVDIRLDETHQTVSEQRSKHASKHASFLGQAFQPVSGQWMLDAIADLTRPTPQEPPAYLEQPSAWQQQLQRSSTLNRRHSTQRGSVQGRRARPSSIAIPSIAIPEASHDAKVMRRASLQFTPTSPTFAKIEDDTDFELEKGAIALSGTAASQRREIKHPRVRWEEKDVQQTVRENNRPNSMLREKPVQPTPDAATATSASLLTVTRQFWPTLPQKWLVALGMIVAVASGAMTPLFSFLFSRLLVTVANVQTDGTGPITRASLLVLLIAFGDGLFAGLKYGIMEVASMNWIDSLRRKNFPRILGQDKKWFDEPHNAAERLLHILMQDGEDSRALLATVLAQFLVVTSMVTVGFVWALVLGWQLTLAGLAIAPVFALIMAVQARMMAKVELRNKRNREEVARRYHDAIANIREIRSMSFESVFSNQFNDSVDSAYRAGLVGGFAEGTTVGVAGALIYIAEALLFYIGALLMVKGDYTYLRMLQVLNLVAFTVAIAAQLMAFVERIAKATQAAHDFGRLTDLRTNTDESFGSRRPDIDGTVTFKDVSFAYPQRPDVPVLRNLSMQLNPGESVAVVGSSGSGKSTIAALLQRLYEPTNGIISVGGSPISSTDVVWLREHVAVVSQSPHLFDATVQENIAYGAPNAMPWDISRAAEAAHIHSFISQLPKGYDTNIGDKATLLSGGQAQRIQIARALLRQAPVLILDECTSALDPANEAAVMDTMQRIKVGRTTLMITHKVPVMRMCDRILVVQDGQIVEQGTYDQLMARRKVFYELTSSGEWA